jgi:Glycosyl hydrolase family 92 N-terminal domain/Phage integrase family
MFRLSNLVPITFLGVLCASQLSRAQTAYDAVDPFIGTTGDGNTFPGASLPFGMIQWSPDSGSDGWYFYDKASITGFSLTHLSGAGCPLYGDFPILPWTGELTTSPAATPNELPELPAGLTRLRFHDLRHSAVSRMIAARIPLPIIAKIVGWSSSTMAKMASRYGHFGVEEMRSAVESISSPTIVTEYPQNSPQSASKGDANIN